MTLLSRIRRFLGIPDLSGIPEGKVAKVYPPKGWPLPPPPAQVVNKKVLENLSVEDGIWYGDALDRQDDVHLPNDDAIYRVVRLIWEEGSKPSITAVLLEKAHLPDWVQTHGIPRIRHRAAPQVTGKRFRISEYRQLNTAEERAAYLKECWRSGDISVNDCRWIEGLRPAEQGGEQ